MVRGGSFLVYIAYFMIKRHLEGPEIPSIRFWIGKQTSNSWVIAYLKHLVMGYHSYNREIAFYADVPEILHQISGETTLALCSRTCAPD